MVSPIVGRIGENGRLVIPSEVRRQLNIKDGDVVQITIEGGRVVIVPRSLLLQRLYESTSALRGSATDAVQDLINERHEEAKDE